MCLSCGEQWKLRRKDLEEPWRTTETASRPRVTPDDVDEEALDAKWAGWDDRQMGDPR